MMIMISSSTPAYPAMRLKLSRVTNKCWLEQPPAHMPRLYPEGGLK